MNRVALLMPSTTYRADDFLAAADALGAEVVLGSDRCHVLEALGAVAVSRDSLVLDFLDPEASVRTLAEYHGRRPIAAVIATDDATAALAARASSALGLANNPPIAAMRARDKLWLRAVLSARASRPRTFRAFRVAADPARAAARVRYPCVLKPRFLSMSRGVIRADDPAQFIAAFERIRALIGTAEMRARGGRAARSILVEDFVPGAEVALEGLLTEGRLEVLAIFDKPDPLDGPFFEETLYVTPSRSSAEVQRTIAATVEDAARAIGLSFGPVHAELRVHGDRVYLVELAPRAIGGLCGRTLRFGLDVSLETLILAHALGRPIPHLRDARASGVMMLPIPRTGTLRSIEGIEDARATPLVEDVVITLAPGREVVALPEGSSYLGFLFARGSTPAAVEEALRAATAKLRVDITPKIPIYTAPT